jgi:hypothetical protein
MARDVRSLRPWPIAVAAHNSSRSIVYPSSEEIILPYCTTGVSKKNYSHISDLVLNPVSDRRLRQPMRKLPSSATTPKKRFRVKPHLKCSHLRETSTSRIKWSLCHDHSSIALSVPTQKQNETSIIIHDNAGEHFPTWNRISMTRPARCTSQLPQASISSFPTQLPMLDSKLN